MRATILCLCALVIAGCSSTRPPRREPVATPDRSPTGPTVPAPGIEAVAGVDSASPAEVESDRQPAFADGPRVRATFPPFAQEVLLEADELEVLAFERGREAMLDEREFRGAPVLASALVRDRRTRVELITRLYQSVEEEEYAAECFNPRHWILARRGERRVEVLLCFECSQLVVYLDGKGQGLQTMSHALGQIVGELVGSGQGRRFHGRSYEEWDEELLRAYYARADRDEGDPVVPVDPRGVAIVAAGANWAHKGERYVEVFAGLHEDAAPGAPSLVLALRKVEPKEAEWLAQALERLGPLAAGATANLTALARDATASTVLRTYALRILGAIGPDAHDALPAVEALAEDPALGEVAKATRAAISAGR